MFTYKDYTKKNIFFDQYKIRPPNLCKNYLNTKEDQGVLSVMDASPCQVKCILLLKQKAAITNTSFH